MSLLLFGAANRIVAFPQTIAITVTPAAASVERSFTSDFTVTLTRSNYAETVTIATTELPSGVTASYPDGDTFTGATTTRTLRLTAAADATIVNDDSFTITASGSGVSDATATATITTLASPVALPFGFGPNAPLWVDGLEYQEELFETPLPVNVAGPSGWGGAVGFDGYTVYNAQTGQPQVVVYNPVRVSYPSVSTPIGTKQVFQWITPGSTETLSGLNQTSTPWPADQNMSLRVLGTWQGTVAFESSSDNGVTWSALTLPGGFVSGQGYSQTGSSTTVNGIWYWQNPISGGRLNQFGNEGKLFRVRASSWTSGTATVYIGMGGGEEAVFASAGRIDKPKAYIRFLSWLDSDFTATGNVEMKSFFVGTNANQFGPASNHYFSFVGRPDEGHDGFSQLYVQLQSNWSNLRRGSGKGPANGQWLDVEMILEMNTPGVANGKAKGWINNTLLLDATNLPYVPANVVNPIFTFVQLVPVWGGSASPPSRTNTIRLGAWYSEGAD